MDEIYINGVPQRNVDTHYGPIGFVEETLRAANEIISFIMCLNAIERPRTKVFK